MNFWPRKFFAAGNYQYFNIFVISGRNEENSRCYDCGVKMMRLSFKSKPTVQVSASKKKPQRKLNI